MAHINPMENEKKTKNLKYRSPPSRAWNARMRMILKIVNITWPETDTSASILVDELSPTSSLIKRLTSLCLVFKKLFLCRNDIVWGEGECRLMVRLDMMIFTIICVIIGMITISNINHIIIFILLLLWLMPSSPL